jgi:hypothetical protein
LGKLEIYSKPKKNLKENKEFDGMLENISFVEMVILKVNQQTCVEVANVHYPRVLPHST